MAAIDYARRSIMLRLVYHGPAGAGKATTLGHLHRTLPGDGALERTDREGIITTRFVCGRGKLGTFDARIELVSATVTRRHDANRRDWLTGADAVVFVADSGSVDEDRESLRELEGRDLPVVFQWNKRDLAGALPVSALEAELARGRPSFETVATTGQGVLAAWEAALALARERVELG